MQRRFFCAFVLGHVFSPAAFKRDPIRRKLSKPLDLKYTPMIFVGFACLSPHSVVKLTVLCVHGNFHESEAKPMAFFHNYLEFVTEFREVPLAGDRNKAPPWVVASQFVGKESESLAE